MEADPVLCFGLPAAFWLLLGSRAGGKQAFAGKAGLSA
jgi:hypothetical protein